MKQKKQSSVARRARRSFTPEFKSDGVRLVKSGKSNPTVARELELTETALREWVRRSDADGGACEPCSSNTRADTVALVFTASSGKAATS